MLWSESLPRSANACTFGGGPDRRCAGTGGGSTGIIEDDVLVGGNTGIYEGTIVREKAVLASGVILTRSTLFSTCLTIG